MVTLPIFKKADSRSWFFLLLVSVAVGISTLTRIALMIRSSASVDFTGLNVSGIFLLGFLFDLLNAAYLNIPVVLYLWLLPGKIYLMRWHRNILYGMFFVITFLLLFKAVAEWFFWDEFNTRFNIIAVDYLVSTTEVIGNIQQSYPIEWIIVVIGLTALFFTYLTRNQINLGNYKPLSFSQRTKTVFFYPASLLTVGFLISHKQHRYSENTYVNELAGTTFVIVADHCASSAGKSELPVNKYHIPMLIYSPDNIAPGKMDRLMSQIDVGPTVLGLLNFPYSSKFYGYDIFKLESGRERAFISTYQSLGYIKGDKRFILSPQLKVESFQVSGKNEQIKQKPIKNWLSKPLRGIKPPVIRFHMACCDSFVNF